MGRSLLGLAVALGLATAATGFAREIEDGKLLVYPQKDGKYKAGDVIGDKVTFYGYAADRWETKHITGILLKRGDQATDEQKHIVYVTAKGLKIDPFIEIDGKEQPIVEAAPSAPAAPMAATVPAADTAAMQTAPASAAASAAATQTVPAASAAASAVALKTVPDAPPAKKDDH